MPLILRLATPADAPALAEMIAAFAAYERLPNQSTAESLHREMGRPDKVFEAVLAIDGASGTPVGFAVIFQTYSTFAAKRGLYLEDIFVREGHRNRGIASAMLRFIANMAVERDLGRVEFTVLLWNTIAIEFFERFGATPTSAWTTYRLSGDWLKRLAAEHTGRFAALPA